MAHMLRNLFLFIACVISTPANADDSGSTGLLMSAFIAESLEQFDTPTTSSNLAEALSTAQAFEPTVEVDYAELTAAIASSYGASLPLGCLFDYPEVFSLGCGEREIAKQILQVQKSAQALARALERSGLGLPFELLTETLVEDMSSGDIELAIIAPAARIARIALSDPDFYGDDSREIYELANLALGYLFTPDIDLQANDLPVFGAAFDGQWVQIGEQCVQLVFNEQVNSTKLLEFTHPSLVNAPNSVSVVNAFGSILSVYENTREFSLADTDYHLSVVTSGYAIDREDFPQFAHVLFVESQVNLVVQRIGPPRWGMGARDRLQQKIDAYRAPYELAAGSGIPEQCSEVCLSSINWFKAYRGKKGALDKLISGAKDVANPSPAVKVRGGIKVLMSIDKAAETYFQTLGDYNYCQIDCIERLENIRHSGWLNREIRLKEARLQSLRAPNQLDEEWTRLQSDIEDRENTLNANERFLDGLKNEFREKLEKGELSPEGITEYEDLIINQNDFVNATRQDIEKKKRKLDEIEDALENLETETKEEEAEKQKLINELRDIREEANETLEVTGQKPLAKELSCNEPGFNRPRHTTCVLKDGKWQLVVDHASLDLALFNLTCALMNFGPDRICRIVNGEAVVVDRGGSIIQAASNRPTQCAHRTYLPGWKCEIINGEPTPVPMYANLEGEVSHTSLSDHCSTVTLEQGKICVDGPLGPVYRDEVNSDYLLRLIERTGNTSCLSTGPARPSMTISWP